ncbi:hypothetical protein CCR75_008622 [Bremia lactucae]|uniref:Uncharacterized protein n=1 Tax=Bremia lactucae TaxID=4779 RepID=A0A976NYU3_BRELC|nr:hypothetical protein CCR75_008622 [Bremia lactucae]
MRYVIVDAERKTDYKRRRSNGFFVMVYKSFCDNKTITFSIIVDKQDSIKYFATLQTHISVVSRIITARFKEDIAPM